MVIGSISVLGGGSQEYDAMFTHRPALEDKVVPVLAPAERPVCTHCWMQAFPLVESLYRSTVYVGDLVVASKGVVPGIDPLMQFPQRLELRRGYRAFRYHEHVDVACRRIEVAQSERPPQVESDQVITERSSYAVEQRLDQLATTDSRRFGGCIAIFTHFFPLSLQGRGLPTTERAFNFLRHGQRHFLLPLACYNLHANG